MKILFDFIGMPDESFLKALEKRGTRRSNVLLGDNLRKKALRVAGVYGGVRFFIKQNTENKRYQARRVGGTGFSKTFPTLAEAKEWVSTSETNKNRNLALFQAGKLPRGITFVEACYSLAVYFRGKKYGRYPTFEEAKARLDEAREQFLEEKKARIKACRF